MNEPSPSADLSPSPDLFRSGVRWNLSSLGVLALSGLVLNILIGRLYDAATLGVFNQVLATYVFFSMLAVGGVNFSALKRISEAPHDNERVRAILWGAMVLTLLCATATTTAYWLLRTHVAVWLNSEGVSRGMACITPGLFFFGINKTLLAAVNGRHHMRAFACFQALRYLNLLTGMGLALAFRLPGDMLAGVFSFSEGILLVSLLIYLREFRRPPSFRIWTAWLRPHALFGAKGALSGALLELYTRVDVLLLGYFLTDHHAGIYSFASLVYEGFLQFGVVLQTNYNPRLSHFLHTGQKAPLIEAFRRGRRMAYRYALLIAPLAALGYPAGIQIVFAGQPEFIESVWPFVILMGGLLAAAGYLPFHGLLLMGGHPGWHTLFVFSVLVINVVLAGILIPLLGLTGAALAVALSLSAATVLLVVMAKGVLGLRLR